MAAEPGLAVQPVWPVWPKQAQPAQAAWASRLELSEQRALQEPVRWALYRERALPPV
jgi:hypothetical protein